MRSFGQTAITGAVAFLCAALGGVAFGEGTDANFSFRRVQPPVDGVHKLITVQIEPRLPGDEDVDAGSLGLDLAGVEPFGALDPVTTPSDAELDGRLKGTNLLKGREASRRVSPDSMRRLGQRYGATIAAATRETQVSPELVLAVMMVESAGRTDAVSEAGAAGLMQLMPATAARFGVRDRFNPEESIRGGTEYLDWLLTEFGGDALLALAGYNAGENAVRKYGGIPPYDETQAYVPKVVTAWRVAASLCRMPQSSEVASCDRQQIAMSDRQ